MYTEQNIELHSPVQFPLFCQSPAFRRKLSGGFSRRYSCISTTTPAKACGELPPKGGTPTRKYSNSGICNCEFNETYCPHCMSSVVFWGGGVDTQHTLPFGTPDEVRAEVRERIDIFGEGGGFVFCTIHNLVANCPLENVLAMFEVVREYR